MSRPLILVATLALFASPGSPQTAEHLAVFPTYTEGVAFDGEGNVFVSETYSDTVSRITAEGEVSAWAKTGGPNGHKVLANGHHLLCDTHHKAVLLLDANGSILEKAATHCGQHAIRGPNDLTLDPRGGFYFTDPGIYPDSWDESVGRVCHVDAHGESRVVLDGLSFPNGIVLRPDGSGLIVAESKSRRVVEYEVVRPGVVGKNRVLAELLGDGIALDGDGDLYVANGRSGNVIVVDQTGSIVRTIPSGIGFVSNLAFDEASEELLYVTGSVNPWTGDSMDEVTRSGVLGRVRLSK